MSLFSMIILLSIFLSPLGSVGKALHGKMYTGVNIQVCLWHSGLVEWGVSEGYWVKTKMWTADTASIFKSPIPLPKLGLNHNCCIALCVDFYFLCMSEKWVFIYSCYQFLSWYLWVSHGNRFLCDWASIIFLLWVLAKVWMQRLKQRDGKIHFSRNSFFES